MARASHESIGSGTNNPVANIGSEFSDWPAQYV